MNYKLLTMLVCALLFSLDAFAQVTVSGTVTDSNTGEVLPGVNVYIQETQVGDATNVDGEYEIAVEESGSYTLVATFVGFRQYTEDIEVGSNDLTVDIELVSSVTALDDVIVTAFGLDREERSLGYSIQEVSGEDINQIQQDNIVSALAGKVAGVQVVGSSGANLGSSERIRIRGANGLSDGQPLFVVDGTPIDNTSFEIASNGSSARGRDLGNLASDINLNNVESVSVLKGAAASALYGNRAANGVILITTKNGEMSADSRLRVDFSNSTYVESVYVLPEYQNQYGGGYSQDFIQYTDPENGQTYNGLNYAADESWGPKMDGQMYRPWWSWFHGDFTGDGQDDYGTEIPLNPQPNNVRDFFERGLRLSNTLSVTNGNENLSYRAGLTNSNIQGVMPNSSLGKTSLSFNGALNHNDKFTSRVAFNYVNTQSEGRPATGYSAVQGNSVQSFNQWFQRQLDMDKLKNYRLEDGTLTSWNIRSNTDLRPLYWDSPYFSVYENVMEDDRDRVYGNYNMSYSVTDNFEVLGKLHLDAYSFTAEDRIATGGLEEDWYYIAQRSRREVNYEAGAAYDQDFQDFSFSGYLGANLRTEKYTSLIQQTVGGLSTPNFFNIDASINRPDVSNYSERKEVRSIFGTATLGFRDLIYVEGSLRNDWSSALPADNNSYLYYGLSGSLVFSEFDFIQSQNILSYGKIRASIAQVGNDLNPFQVFQTYNSSVPYGNSPTQSVPNTLTNPNLRPAISSDYEFGIDLRFLSGRIRTDVNYYNSVREDEILDLTVPGSSGYDESLVNAGKFTTKGWEILVGGTPVQTQDFTLNLDVNFAQNTSKVNKLAEGISSRLLESGFFGVGLYANEGEEWGEVVTTGGYGGYLLHENGERIVNSNGSYARQTNKPLGNILPDWTGGFNLGLTYKNFSLSTFVDFQKGGKFYSITRMFNAYSGLGKETVGNNTLGNPLRDPVANTAGESGLSSVSLDNAAPNSGGVLVEGVDESGSPVAYLRDAPLYFLDKFFNKEAWLADASYIKLNSVKLTYNIPVDVLSSLPITNASVALDIRNAWLIYASVDGVDPSIIQNNGNGFGFWEGGGLPSTRSIGLNVNLSF